MISSRITADNITPDLNRRIASLRRKPSVSEEIYRDYATKKELSDLRCDFNKTMGEFFARQHNNQSAVEDKFQAILHSVGRIEGELKKCPNICK